MLTGILYGMQRAISEQYYEPQRCKQDVSGPPNQGRAARIASLTRNPIMKILPLIVFLLSAAFVRTVLAAVEAVPFRIEESRSVAYGDDKVSRGSPSLKLILSLSGPEAESSVRYGDLKLDQAADDQGTSLIPTKDTFNEAGKFKEYSNQFFRKSKFKDSDKPAAPQVELSLAPAKRSATKIARLQGTFSLAEQGTIQTIELGGLNGAGKKSLPIPASAHLSVIADVPATAEVRSLGIEVSGDENALESLKVVDASGNEVSNGMSSWAFNGGPAHKSLGLKKPLDGSMKLVAKVALDRKISKVSLDLMDIALP